MKDLNDYNTDLYEFKKTIYELSKENESLKKENKKLSTSLYKRAKGKLRRTLIKEKKEPLPTDNYKGLKCYDSYYQDDMDFSKYSTDIKTLTFYLPQFHEFKENNEWWGKGFMEWTNTKKSKPRFEGHYQPREPHDDFGYYTLDNIETIKKQVELAKEHGIYGFCFYYYWFSGKRLLEKPVDLFLKDKSIDFPVFKDD